MMKGMTIVKAARLLREGQLTVSELCSSCLAIEDKYNAFVTVDHDIIAAQVKASEDRFRTGTSLGVLDGIPIAIKDNFSTKGIRTTCASRALLDYVPTFNATVVQRLMDQGMILIGKANLDEFAMGSTNTSSEFGPAKNPWPTDDRYGESKESYVAGGSSGGSAAAVAAGLSLASIGSDTGGSTRLPAAWCGLTGLKPTYGRLSRYGLIPLANSFDSPGVIAKTIEDVISVYQAIAGHDFKDATSSRQPVESQDNVIEESANSSGKPLAKYTIGIAQEHHVTELDKEVLECWSETIKKMELNGANIVKVSLPHSHLMLPCYTVLTAVEVSSNMARYDGLRYGFRSTTGETTEEVYGHSRAEGFGSAVRRRILSGTYFTLRSNRHRYLEKAQKVRRLILNDYESVFDNGIDMILSPSALTTAAPCNSDIDILESLQHDYYLVGANLTGMPSAVIPTKLAKNGLPISMSLIASRFQEGKIFHAARIIEKEFDFLAS